MLSPSEFTVGNVGGAKPLSLILPINKYDETILVGHFDGAAVAVFLSGQFKSCFFESEGNGNWRGLIIPNVRVEVDETSLVDTDHNGAPSLPVVRVDTRLVIPAKREQSFGRPTLVTLHDNLASAGEFQATFARWQIVIGEGLNKRAVWSNMNDSNS